jgi:hypothetical protein
MEIESASPVRVPLVDQLAGNTGQWLPWVDPQGYREIGLAQCEGRAVGDLQIPIAAIEVCRRTARHGGKRHAAMDRGRQASNPIMRIHSLGPLRNQIGSVRVSGTIKHTTLAAHQNIAGPARLRS